MCFMEQESRTFKMTFFVCVFQPVPGFVLHDVLEQLFSSAKARMFCSLTKRNHNLSKHISKFYFRTYLLYVEMV